MLLTDSGPNLDILVNSTLCVVNMQCSCPLLVETQLLQFAIWQMNGSFSRLLTYYS